MTLMELPQMEVDASDFEKWKIQHFQPEEFACKCGCGQILMVPQFIKMLDEFRNFCNFPFRVTSAYRCAGHPVERAKVNGPGPHNTGCAVDVALSHRYAYEIMMKLGQFKCSEPRINFWGIGWAQRGDTDQRYVHLDACSDAPGRPRPHIWSY
jgi:hypothetical protein